MKTHMLETPGGFRIACGKFVEDQGAKTSDPAKVTCRACLKSVHLPARGLRGREGLRIDASCSSLGTDGRHQADSGSTACALPMAGASRTSRTARARP